VNCDPFLDSLNRAATTEDGSALLDWVHSAAIINVAEIECNANAFPQEPGRKFNYAKDLRYAADLRNLDRRTYRAV
jgi:hypothetical protein